MAPAMAALSASRLAFYGTAATVIPIFMLAIAVQLRASRIFGLSTRQEAPSRHAFLVAGIVAIILAVVTIALLLAGEVLAIAALYRNNDHGNGGWVFAALVVGALALLVGTADAVFREMRESLTAGQEAETCDEADWV